MTEEIIEFTYEITYINTYDNTCTVVYKSATASHPQTLRVVGFDDIKNIHNAIHINAPISYWEACEVIEEIDVSDYIGEHETNSENVTTVLLETGRIAPTPTESELIERCRSDKKSEIMDLHDLFLQSGMRFKFYEDVDGELTPVEDKVQIRGVEDMNNLSTLEKIAQSYINSGVDTLIPFRSDSNKIYNMTAPEVVLMWGLAIEYTSLLQKQLWDLKDLLSSCTNVDEIQAIQWEEFFYASNTDLHEVNIPNADGSITTIPVIKSKMEI